MDHARGTRPLLVLLCAAFVAVGCSGEGGRTVSGCTIEPEASCPNISFERGVELRDANLKGADLSGAVFADVDLRDANLKGADLSGAELDNTDLRGADLTGANLRDVLAASDLESGRQSRLSGAVFVDADLSGAQLSNSDLRGADLTGADLTGAELTGADLTDAVLVGTRLDETRLFGTKLGGAQIADIDGSPSTVESAQGLTPASLALLFGVSPNQVAFALVERGITVASLQSSETVCEGTPAPEAAEPGSGEKFHPIATNSTFFPDEWLAPGPEFVEFVACVELESEIEVATCGPYVVPGLGAGSFSVPVFDQVWRVRVIEAKTAVGRADETFLAQGARGDACPSTVDADHVSPGIRPGLPSSANDLVASFVGQAPSSKG